ncbi:MAG: hypothetical protein GX349_07725 [Firmicutes bacterium]|nr:hypothetical protein [Bacillota bacterium]
MFTKGRFVLILVAALLLAFLIRGGVLAQGPLPGSEDDPLVGKSYVDKYIKLEVVNLEAGQCLLADGGAEIILRGGQGRAITSPLGGLADVTQGRDVGSGEVIAANHLLLVPRSDGRGVKAVTDLILLIRGRYWIE